MTLAQQNQDFALAQEKLEEAKRIAEEITEEMPPSERGRRIQSVAALRNALNSAIYEYALYSENDTVAQKAQGLIRSAAELHNYARRFSRN